MTLSTSLVAVWYSSDSSRSRVRCLQFAIGLGARDGDDRLLGKGLQQCDLAVGEAADLSHSSATTAPIAAPSRNSGNDICDLTPRLRTAALTPGTVAMSRT